MRPLLGIWPATQACALDWESNWWPFGSQAGAQSTEPLQPGLILGNLIMVCLGVVLFGSNFFGTLWASWTSWKSISFARFGKFSIIFSNEFSMSCSSSSPSGTPMIWMLECLKLSRRFLNLSSFFWTLFLHSVLVECLLLPSAPNHWFESQFPSLHCWLPVHFPLFHFTQLSLFPLFFYHNLFCEHPDYQCFELCIW